MSTLQITQYKHLIYKEWLKTRWWILLSFIGGIGVILVSYMLILQRIHAMGESYYFSTFIQEQPTLFSMYKYIVILSSIAIGISQFRPEFTNKRIKLSLHLPMPTYHVVYSMIGYGFMILTVVIAIEMLFMSILMCTIYPWEVLKGTFLTVTPWILGGWCCYFAVVSVLFEPKKITQCAQFVWYALLLNLFFSGYGYGNVQPIIPILFIVTVLISLSTVYTSHRFIKGTY